MNNDMETIPCPSYLRQVTVGPSGSHVARRPVKGRSLGRRGLLPADAATPLPWSRLPPCATFTVHCPSLSLPFHVYSLGQASPLYSVS